MGLIGRHEEALMLTGSDKATLKGELTSAGCRRMSREFGVSGRMMPPRQSSRAGISGIANDRRQPVQHVGAHKPYTLFP